MIVCVWVVSENNDRAKYTAKVAHDALPSDIISDTIRRRSRTMGMTREHAERCIEEYKHLYVLKVCGCNEFLLAEVPISQYKVWRDFYIKKNLSYLYPFSFLNVGIINIVYHHEQAQVSCKYLLLIQIVWWQWIFPHM